MIDEMETQRAKLLFIVDSSDNSKTSKVEAAQLEYDLWTLEGRVHDIFQTGAREDIFRNPAKLLERFLAIQKESATGSADFAPTDQDDIVYDKLNNDLIKVESDFKTLKQEIKPVPEIKIKSKLNIKKNKQ